jgi:hypothetical protein
MSRLLIRSVLLLILAIPAPSVAAKDCRKKFVANVDGYANIRSTPRINSTNIIGTWYSGGSIKVIRQNLDWLQITAPTSGWIHTTQVGEGSCQNAQKMRDTIGHPKIKVLGKQVIAGDANAAQSLLQMSRGMDGETLEIYAATITNWVEFDPNSFISILSKQSNPVRQSVLQVLDFGLGSGSSSQRSRFELGLSTFPQTNIVVTEWRSRKKDRSDAGF